ncbi:MAG TPA: OPT family oligopeptide transporter, partial [Vulgatibacter sp.]
MSAPSILPPTAPEAAPAAIPLPEDPELRWLATTYRHGERQLTVRAVVTGMALGGIMCLSNLYVVLKTGWSLGVTLTACILAFAIFRGMKATRLVKEEFTILENNAMGSVASAAGFMTGGGNMAALPALLMLTAVRPDGISLFVWFSVIALLGVFAAIPVKRQLINREQLAFPTGTATAETLRSLHEAAHAKEGGGGEKAKFLGIAAGVGALLAWFRDAKGAFMPFNLPDSIPLPFQIAGRAAKDWTLTLKSELVLFGAGALMSFRTGWSLLLGAILTYVFLAPSLLASGQIAGASYKAIVAWTLWPGAAVLVASGLTSFALDWKSISRSFAGLSGLFGKKKEAVEDPIAAVEVPDSWFPIGFAILGPIVVFLMWRLFEIPIWAGVIAVPLAVVMGFVASRVTGETDVTPTKALGPVTQLVYGVVTPGNLAGNLMSANVTGGIGLHAADLLTDLKSGYLLGANPRQQFYAQLFGVLAGAAVVVPAFWLLVPDPS